jgi:hypothetical protein
MRRFWWCFGLIIYCWGAGKWIWLAVPSRKCSPIPLRKTYRQLFIRPIALKRGHCGPDQRKWSPLLKLWVSGESRNWFEFVRFLLIHFIPKIRLELIILVKNARFHAKYSIFPSKVRVLHCWKYKQTIKYFRWLQRRKSHSNLFIICFQMRKVQLLIQSSILMVKY